MRTSFPFLEISKSERIGKSEEEEEEEEENEEENDYENRNANKTNNKNEEEENDDNCENQNDNTTKNKKPEKKNVLVYDEVFMRQLNTKENCERALDGFVKEEFEGEFEFLKETKRRLRLRERKRERREHKDVQRLNHTKGMERKLMKSACSRASAAVKDDDDDRDGNDDDDDDDKEEEDEVVVVLEEDDAMSSLRRNMSSLWASDGEFEEDVKEIRKSIRISEAKRVQREKETKRRTTMVMSEFSCKYQLATPWVRVNERSLQEHAIRSFRRIEESDGDLMKAFGMRRLRKLYGNWIINEEKKMYVIVERVEDYDDDNGDEKCSDLVIVGCVDASSAGLDVFLGERREGDFEKEVMRIAHESASSSNEAAFVFVKLDSLVSAFNHGLGCRFECFDAKNNFAPIDFICCLN